MSQKDNFFTFTENSVKLISTQKNTDKISKSYSWRNIEKIHPIILFSLFLILITAILPLVFLSPLPSATTYFQNSDLSGSQKIEIKNLNVQYSITFTNIDTFLFNNNTNGIQIILIFNSLYQNQFSFNITNIDSIRFPLEYSIQYKLTPEIYFNSKIDIKTNIRFQFSKGGINNAYFAISFESILGQFNMPIYDRWFVITTVTSGLLFIIAISYLLKIKPLNVKYMLKSFLYSDYNLYNESLDLLNENYLSIFFSIPSIIIFTVLFQYYVHIALLTQNITLLYQNILDLASLLVLQTLMIISFPKFPAFLLDKFKPVDRLMKKSRMIDNIIFLPFLAIYYLIIATIITFTTDQIILFLIIFLSFIIASFIYFLALKHHCWKYGYNLNDQKILLYSFSTRLIYNVIIFFIIQFLVLGQSSIPFYLFFI